MLILLLMFGMGAINRPQIVQAEEAQPAPSSQANAFDLILAMNTLRVSYGLPPLVEDPIINAVAQSTAATMARRVARWSRSRSGAAGCWPASAGAITSAIATVSRIQRVVPFMCASLVGGRNPGGDTGEMFAQQRLHGAGMSRDL